MLSRFFGAFLVGCMLLLPTVDASAARGYDPALEWQTLESPRFAVHFSGGQRNLAVRVSRISEQVLDSVGGLFDYTPDGTIHIVLSDSYDGANGSATVMPRNLIRLFLTAPVETTGLASYDEWLRILLIHEIAHLCHIDQHHGLNSFFRLFVGKYVSMNAYAPQWMTEGVATYAETILTSTGRGRSTYVDMVLRLAALGDQDIHLDQAHVLFSDWPGPTVAYFWGGRFHLYLAKRFGHEKIRDFYKTYASTPIPYIHGLIGWAHFGKPLAALWEDFLDDVREDGLALKKAVSESGATNTVPLVEGLKQMSGARFLDDGRVIFSHWSPVDGSTVRLFDPEKSKADVILRDVYSVRFGSKGKQVVYSKSAITERFNNYADLYVLDLESKKVVKLQDTKRPGTSLRARDPTLTPSGDILFVTNELHQNALKIGTRLEDGLMEIRTLVPGSGDTQFSSPVVSPDGRHVAVSVFFAGGYRDIVLFDLESGTVAKRVTADRALDNNPVFSPDGAYLLFDSDRSGVFNIYAYHLENDTYHQVTNVVGGVFQPDVSDDASTLLMRYAQAGGFALHTMTFDPSLWRSATFVPSAQATYHETRFAQGVTRAEEEPIALREDFEKLSPYQPLKSLMPSADNFIILPAVFVFNGDLSASLLTGGYDAVGEHSWGLAVRRGLETKNPSVVASYSNDQWYPTISIYGSKQEIPYEFNLVDENGRGLGTDWAFEARRGFGGSVGWPIGQRHALFAGYSFETRSPYDGVSEQVLSGASFGDFASSYAGYQYANLRGYQRSVSPERGVTASVVGRYYGKALGATFNQVLMRTASQLFLNNPIFDNHVLTMRFASSFSLGPEFKERFRLGGGFGNSMFSTQIDSFYPLRGFSSTTGDVLEGSGLAALYMEYRFPIWYPQRGLWSLPLFFDRLYGVLFMDSGSVFGRSEGGSLSTVYRGAWDELTKGRMSVGAELRGRIAMGWAYWIIPRVSIAVPIMDQGRFTNDLGYRFEFSLGSPF